jgi:hypothetical protein
MIKSKFKWVFMAILLSIGSMSMAQGEAEEKEKKFNFSGDVRFRTEIDRNSKRMDGTDREDRDRLRYRLRFALNYKMNNNFEIGARIRTGNPQNQQSTHITFGDEFDTDHIAIERAFIKAQTNNGLWIWAGKNSIPFWRQNESLWDDDVSPEGISAGGEFKLDERSSLAPIAGVFIAGHSGKNFSDDSSISVIQITFNRDIGNNKITASSGILRGSNLPNTPDGTHSFYLDYSIWASSMQYHFKNIGLKLGLDYYINFEDYNDQEDIEEIFRDQKNGLVFSTIYNFKKWEFGYYYDTIEKYAVIDYFAQDDWVRWGNEFYTRSSNFSGHEFRINYSITDYLMTILRAYFVEGIKTTETDLETGTRVRLDINFSF